LKISRLNLPRSLFSDVFIKYIFTVKKSIEILFGGAGGGKTVHSAFKDIKRVREGQNLLVIKQVYGHIKDSYFSDLKTAITAMGIDSEFEIRTSPLKITHKNGCVILFRGLDKVDKLKGVRAPNGEINHITIEEITDTEEDGINQLQFRSRGGGSRLDKSEVDYIKDKIEDVDSVDTLLSQKFKDDIFEALGFRSREDFIEANKTMAILFNPIYKEHWVYERFFTDKDGRDIFQIEDKEYEDDTTYIMHSNHWDNQFLTVDDHRKYESFKFINEYYYNVYCMGNWGVLGDVVFSNWRVADLSQVKAGVRKRYFGMDYGWSPDPFACVSCAIVGRKIYVMHEVGGHKAHTRDICESIRPLVQDHAVICDNSENRATSELVEFGIDARKVIKRRGTVNSSNLYCIQWFRFFEIVIDPSCVEFIKEIKTYQWDKDSNGKTIAKPKDGDDHYIQAMFYAFNEKMDSLKPSEVF